MSEDLPLDNRPLPSMFTLYNRDIHHCSDTYLHLPVKIALAICRDQPRTYPYLMDFIQEGNFALLQCIHKYDGWEKERGDADFRKYAASCIRGYIHAYFARIPTIYIPHGSRDYLLKKGKAKEIELLEDGLSLEMLREAIGDRLVEPTNMQLAFCAAKRKRIDGFLASLPTKERQVIIWFYGLDGIQYDHKEIAQMLKVNVRQVQNLQKNAENRINGTRTTPAREQREQVHAQQRREKLQALYDLYQGRISGNELMRLAACDREAVKVFLHSINAPSTLEVE